MEASAAHERSAILAEVDRFVRQSVAPRAARHEEPMGARAFAAILDDAEALGLAGSAAEATGLAPWEELETGAPPRGSLDVLERVARANAAVAMAIHQRALARVVARRASLGAAEQGAVAIEGSLGVGRISFARLVAGAPLDEDDRALLGAIYAPAAERVLVLDPGFGTLVTPAFDGRAMRWRRHERAALALAVEPHAHGLDELLTARVRAATAGSDVPASPAQLGEAFCAQAMALVAIALGSVDRAYDIARRFAAQRVQGGRPIDGHPAVLALLGRARRALDGARAELATLAGSPVSASAVGRVAAFRADASVRLADAAHAALQVAGGLGYMRETGLEKVSRDVNALRVMAGAPPELELVAAEWERLHG